MITYIIDFDNTITQGEALDELANISLAHDANKKETIDKIEHITRLGMSGSIGFDEALSQRILLLKANLFHIEKLIDVLKKNISSSFIRNKTFIQQNASNIYIVSGGFKEFILPVVLDFGILENQVFANEFITNEKKQIIGFDKNNLLSKPQGKVNTIKNLHLPSKVIAVGDGFTDYELKKYNTVDSFYLFTEHITRANLVPLADRIISSFDQLVTLHYA